MKSGKLQQLASTMTVVAIGPGIGRHPETVEFVHEAVRTLKCPLVIDADGLNAFDGKTELLDGSKRALVLTPHPGEMGRLAGISTKAVQADRLNVARTFAREHRLVLVLKGNLDDHRAAGWHGVGESHGQSWHGDRRDGRHSDRHDRGHLSRRCRTTRRARR